MKLQIATVIILFTSAQAFAQFGLGKKSKGGDNGSDNKLPKGVEIYDTPHQDENGISGKYYLKYPIPLEAKSMMGMPKTFKLSEMTIQYFPAEFYATIYFTKDDIKNQIRSESSKYIDLEIKGGSKLGSAYLKKYKLHVFKFENKLANPASKEMYKQAFCDPFVFQYSKDPEIFIVAAVSSDTKNGKEVAKFFNCGSNDYLGSTINIMSKNKEKLADWDSTRIADEAFEEFMQFIENEKNVWADEGNLPPRRVVDAQRDKENFDLIKPFAERDKPKPWGLNYCYIAKDWQIMKKNNVVTHRTSLVVAVSNPMTDGLCKYIYCSINQTWDGEKFGPSFMAGFNGALIPISCEKAAEFKKK